MSETRKLAAILVADVVGYSRLAHPRRDLILQVENVGQFPVETVRPNMSSRWLWCK
jgi:hypothetical protein